MKAWLKGGLIGLLIGIIGSLSYIWANLPAITGKPGNSFFSFIKFISTSLFVWGITLFYVLVPAFIIGALIGWLIGRFKK